jgi:hypothetical protein
MIQFNFDPVAGTAKLSSSNVTVVLLADVPVEVVFPSAPGTVGQIAVAFGDDAATPNLLAYTNTFEAENATTYAGLLDCSDSRLAAFMTGKGPTPVNCQVSAVINGVQLVAPNVQITVQPAIVTGPAGSEGGPTYYTQAQTDAAIAAALVGLTPAPEQTALQPAATATAALFAATVFDEIDCVIQPQVGSGAYTATYTLPDAAQARGALAWVSIEFPASANPTIQFSDAGVGVIAAGLTNPSPAAAAYWLGLFRFDGTQWRKRFSLFQ